MIALPALHPGRRWCALHTRARHEKKVAQACEQRAVPCYLPLFVHRTISGGRVNTFELPLFAGYLFAALADGELAELKHTNSVAQRLEARSQEQLLSDLDQVRIVLAARAAVEAAPLLARGQRVVVTRGPLVGLTGVVVQHRNRTRLQIAVEAIAQALLVDVAREAVAPV